MGSPITFSGFNSIDFNVVLNAIMQQESQPLQALQAKQRALQATDTNLGQLATKLDALRTAANTLSRSSSLVTHSATSSDTAALTATASASAQSGRYDIAVDELALAQVTVSSSYSADADTTVVATGGTLTLGGESVTVSSPVTLTGLAALINADADIPVRASVIATATNEYRLVLTSKESGEANAFTIDNQLTGSVAFTDTDNDGISGDSALDNAVQATNAALTINSIPVESASNTLTDVVPGLTLTLLQKDKTVVVTVSRDDEALAGRVDTFVSSFNDLLKFYKDQTAAAGKGTAGAIGRNSLLRGLWNELRSGLIGEHGSGTYTKLAEVGIGFTRTGELTLDRDALFDAVQADPEGVTALFADTTAGAFGSVKSLIDDYTSAGGFVPDARTRLTDEIARVGRRMDDMQVRLAVRRAALQKEFIAADLAITRLNGQRSSLGSFGASLSTGSL